MLNPFAGEFTPGNKYGSAAVPIPVPPRPGTKTVVGLDTDILAALEAVKDQHAHLAEHQERFAPMVSQPSADLHFEEVFNNLGHDSRQSSVASQLETKLSLSAEDAVLEAAKSELLADGPVESQCITEGSTSAKCVGPQDFDILRVVGQGAFGKVFQVKYKPTGQVYAMKVMRKERILERDHGEYVKAERDVMTAIFHPYIVTLRFSFQTPHKLYLILDFINGGHLFFNLYRQGVFSEDVARLYTAEMVDAISYLHSRGIVHRDLKPENVLLDSEGHVRLTDFGLAKANLNGESDRTNSFIGTMEYMAPEIVQGSGHGKAVDWWSIGILLYEMLCGVPPFRAKSRQALQTQIVSGKVKYPKFLSTEALNLLKALLTREPTKRLGCGPEGDVAIRKHPFFKSINWTKLNNREIPSSFRPTVKNSLSVENFDKLWTDQPPVDSPCGTPTNDHAARIFENFTYVAPCFLTEAVARMAAQQANNASAA